MIALDEISLWRPGWDYKAWKRLYYGGFANKEVTKKLTLFTLNWIKKTFKSQDRLRMRTAYEQVKTLQDV